MCSTLTQSRLSLAVALLLAGATPLCLAQQPAPAAPETPLAPQLQTPAQAAPTPPPPNRPVPLRPLAPEVQQVFAQAREAYEALKTYQDLGSVTTTMVIAGRSAENTSPASTTFEAPAKFISNYQAMSLYSDGQTLWIYTPVRGKYYQQPLEQQAPAQAAVPTPQSIMRNLPVLTMLACPDQSLLSTASAFESTYRGQEQLAGKAVDHVTLISPADVWFGAAEGTESGANRITLDLFFDAQTHMLLRLNINMTGAMRNRITQLDQQRGPEQINQATWQYNAGQVRLNTPIAAETFTFKPPANARQVDSVAALFTATGGTAPINDEEQAEHEEAQQARMPYPAPDFTLPDLAGQQVKLSDLRGKVVVMDFWATWCGPCRLSLPHIQRLHEDLKDKGVVVLGVDIGEESQTVLAYAEKNKMIFQILLDDQDKVGPLYKVRGIPHTVLIDQRGQVVKTHTGFLPGQEKTLRSEVQALLANPAGATATRPGGAATTQPAPVATRPAATQPTAAKD